MADDESRHGTFKDVIEKLPYVRDMGFDVLYFTPIHPIGRTNRKGRNNSLTPAPDDPGSPYAIGAADGLPAPVKAAARDTIAFGRATWPHMMVRVMAAEQIYRAVTILTDHPYHRV